MPKPAQLQKAQLIEMAANLKDTASGAAPINVQFNPETLKVMERKPALPISVSHWMRLSADDTLLYFQAYQSLTAADLRGGRTLHHFAESDQKKIGPGLKGISKRGTFSVNGNKVTAESLKSWIENGDTQMPGMKDTLDPAQIQQALDRAGRGDDRPRCLRAGPGNEAARNRGRLQRQTRRHSPAHVRIGGRYNTKSRRHPQQQRERLAGYRDRKRD